MLGDVADDAREAAEKLFDGHHSNLQDAFVKLVEDARLKSHGVRKLRAQRIAGVFLVEFREGTIEHGLTDDQFAHQVHHGINTGGIHAERALGDRRSRRAASARRRCVCVLDILSYAGLCLRGLRFQQIAEQFMFSSLRGGRPLEADIGNDGRDAAALRQSLFGLRTRESGLDDFDRRSRRIVFRAEGDDGAATMKNVSNELEGRRTHQAIWIDAQGNIVNGLAAMDGFGNHELFVFGPFESSRELGCFLQGLFLSGRNFQQPLDHGVKRIYRGRIHSLLISGEHGAETISGSENDFSHLGSAGPRDLRSKDILKLVREFAQLVKPARGGIPFQGVDGTADTTDDFLIGGMSFKLKPRFIERLQQFAGALKEESAQLAVAILGRTFQELTSLRWYAVPLFSWTMRNF